MNTAPPPGTPLAQRFPTTRTLHVQYYAVMRERAGRNEEELVTAASTPAELYAELSRRHPFALTREQLKVAVNAEFADWSAPLRDRDSRGVHSPGGRRMSAFRFSTRALRHRGATRIAGRSCRRRLCGLRGLGAQSQRGPGGRAPGIRSLRSARRQGRRTHHRRGAAHAFRIARAACVHRLGRSRSASWRCGWA